MNVQTDRDKMKLSAVKKLKKKLNFFDGFMHDAVTAQFKTVTITTL